MERSEPSLVPEWLRSNGGGTDGGSSSHHFASSQADAPVLALPKRSRSSKNISNSDASHSSLLEQSSSSNSRRSSSSNGFPKHDKNSFARSYCSFTRSQRDRDRERLTITDNWDSEYSDSLRGMIIGKAEGTLRRSQSMVSKRQGEVPQRRFSTDLRNGSHNNHENENSSHSVGSSVTGIPKVSLERDFPVLGSEERPKTPDVIRVSSPGLSRGIQSLSIGNPPSVGSEGWTSALVEVPPGAGSNSGGSSPAMQPSAVAPSGSNSASGAGSTSSGLNMAEALAQAPAHSHNIPQLSVQTQRDELAIAQSKKLIPMTPKALQGVTPSDKLKPKTPVRSSESAVALKKGMQHPSPLQLGSQAIRGTSVRVDSPKSPSSGKLLLLKPGRENGASSVLKDIQSPTANVSNKVPNGQSTGSPSVASVPLKNPHNPRVPPVERKTSTFGMNSVPVVDKRSSLAQAQSRSNFFKLMREKSMNNTSGTAESGTAVSSDVVDKSDKELKEVTSVQVTPVETGSELKCNGEISTMAESFAHTREIDNAAIYPDDEEEIAFLISLGWDDKAGDDEGLTEEEINSFCQEVMKRKPSPRVCRLLQKLESFFD